MERILALERKQVVKTNEIQEAIKKDVKKVVKTYSNVLTGDIEPEKCREL